MTCTVRVRRDQRASGRVWVAEIRRDGRVIKTTYIYGGTRAEAEAEARYEARTIAQHPGGAA